MMQDEMKCDSMKLDSTRHGTRHKLFLGIIPYKKDATLTCTKPASHATQGQGQEGTASTGILASACPIIIM